VLASLREDRKSLLVPYHFFLKPLTLGVDLFEGLGFGKIFGGKDWFRVGVYVLVRFMGLVMEIG
jgi:hypothetical protein